MRDISDLKARLGLKKGPSKKKGGISSGLPGALPAPPGAEPPAAKVSDDPFGALNMAATQEALRRAQVGPEIVVVEKGEEVESVDKKAVGLKIALYAAIILMPLGVGIWVGQIGSSAADFNRTIDDAGKIGAEIERVRKQLKDYEYAFLNANKGKDSGPWDGKLNKALAEVKFSPVQTSIVYSSFLYNLNDMLVADTLQFAADSIKLTKKIKRHLDLTRRDFKYLLQAQKESVAARPKETTNLERYSVYAYAVLLSGPNPDAESDKTPVGAQLVQIGMPMCGADGVSTDGECDAQPTGFKYRVSPNGAWKTASLYDPRTVEGGKYVPGGLLHVLPGETMEALVKGNEAHYAENTYNIRIAALAREVERLRKIAEDIENKLKSKSQEGHRFSFGM